MDKTQGLLELSYQAYTPAFQLTKLWSNHDRLNLSYDSKCDFTFMQGYQVGGQVAQLKTSNKT